VRYGLREQGRDIVEMYEKTRADGFGAEVKRRIMIGTYVLSAGYYDAYYLRAQKVRTLIKRDFDEAYAAGIDAVLTPATPSAAFGIGEKGSADPVEMYLNDIFTVTVNMAGLPGIAVPAGLDSQGLPLGLQLIGRPFDEETPRSGGDREAAGRFTRALVGLMAYETGSSSTYALCGRTLIDGPDAPALRHRAAGGMMVKQRPAGQYAPERRFGARAHGASCSTSGQRAQEAGLAAGLARDPVAPLISWTIAYEDSQPAKRHRARFRA
jgi:hypothetical protein